MVSRLIFPIVVGLVIAFESASKATEPPPEAKSFIANALSDIDNTPGLSPTVADTLKGYLHDLLSNWDETLAKDPASLPLKLQHLQESFQFYYGGRTTITPPTEASLLFPPLPFALLAEGTGVHQSDFSNPAWVLPGVRIRMAWLQLLAAQDPTKLLHDDIGLRSMVILVQTLNQLMDKRAQNVLSASDAKVIMATLETFPILDDASIEQLAADHDSASKFKPPFPRVTTYKTLFHALANIKGQSVFSLWQVRPDLFQSTVIDAIHKLQEQLSDSSKIIEALPASPVQQQLVTVYSKRLNLIMTQFNSIPIRSVKDASSTSPGVATPADSKLVDQYVFHDWSEKSDEAGLQISQFLNNPSVDPTKLSQMFGSAGTSTPEADMIATILRAFSGSATPEVNEALMGLRKSIQDQQEELFQKLPTSSK